MQQGVLIEGKISFSVYFHPHQRSLGNAINQQRQTKGDFSIQIKPVSIKCRLQIAECRLGIKCTLGIKCRLQTADWV